MKLSINNFKGIKSLDLDVPKKAIYISGPNESGKSTIIEAIRSAFGNDTVPGKRMGEIWGTGGRVKLDLESIKLQRTRSSCTPAKGEILKQLGMNQKAFSLCMTQDIVGLSAKELAAILAEVSSSDLDVKVELIDAGCASGKVKMLPRGISLKDAKAQAEGYRAGCKQRNLLEIGEDEGIDPGLSELIQKTRKDIATLKQQLFEKSTFLAQKNGLEEFSDSEISTLPSLKRQLASMSVKEKKESIAEKISWLKENKGCDCPTCSQFIGEDAADVLVANLEELEDEIQRHNAEADKAIEERNNLSGHIANIEAYIIISEALNDLKDASPEALHVFEEQLADLEAKSKKRIEWETVKRENDKISRENAQAKTNWDEWNAIAKACDKLAGKSVVKLNPLAERLAETSKLMGIDASIEGTTVLYQGRPFDQGSESARWRVSLLVYEAVNHFYRFPVLIIDEASINDVENRKALNGLISVIKGDYEHIVIGSTMFPGEIDPPVDHPWAMKVKVNNFQIVKG